MSASDLHASLRYRLYRRLRTDAEPVNPELMWPEPVRRRPYEAYGACARFLAARDHEVIISGPAETGKTLAALNKVNDLAWSNPGLQAAIVRKSQRSMAGSVLQTYQRKVLPTAAPVTVLGGHSPERFLYPNGAVVWVGGMDNPDKVLSSERDLIYVNQAEELTLPDWETLVTRVTGRAGVLQEPQIIGDCNPAAPTHWIKTRAAAKNLRLIESTHKDNPRLYEPRTGKITAQGKRTLAVLDRLTGNRKLRLRHGIWANPEGAIYEPFDEVRHKVRSKRIPPLWPRMVGIDPVGAMVGALWVAWDPKGEILHVYREYLEPFGVTTPEHVKEILALSAGETIWAWVGGGPSERQPRTDWRGAGIPLLAPPAIEVWIGIDRVTQLLADFRLVIHDCCVNLLSEVGSYQRVMKGDVATDRIQDKEQFHLLDALRYIVAWLTEPGEQTQVGRVVVRAGPEW